MDSFAFRETIDLHIDIFMKYGWKIRKEWYITSETLGGKRRFCFAVRSPVVKLFLRGRESQIRINSGALQHGGWQITKCLWQEEVAAVTYSILLGQTVISRKLQERFFFFTTQAFAIPFVASRRKVASGERKNAISVEGRV